jgi:hypothetical protein
MNREIMQQALDALKYHTEHTYPFHLTNVAIEALQKELAQPEQEPQVCCGDYEKCWKACTPRGRWLAEKELAKPEQEPVATVKFIHNKKAPDVDWHCNICIRDGAKLYTSPPRKEWVGLTKHEIWECQKPGLSDDVYKLIETKLRERNI